MVPKVTYFCDVYLNHSSYVIAGLLELEKQRRIALDFRLVRGTEINERDFWITYLVLSYPSGKTVRICIDLNDSSQWYCPTNLERCDLYYKANYSKAVVDTMPNREQAKKVRPFGLYFAPRPNQDRAILKRYFGNLIANAKKHKWDLLPINKENIYRLYSVLYHNYFQNYLSKLKMDEYVGHEGHSRTAQSIFFNPRCWPANYTLAQKINALRAEIILQCRMRFGNAFVGGFVDDTTARSLYPEAILHEDLSHSKYIQRVKAAAINIYTQGLHNCISWKLLEFMAAGSAVVGERISNDLPFGELPEDCFIPFDTVAGCIQGIERLLEDPDLLAEIRERCASHYRSFLAPDKKLERLIFTSDSHP
jgi:hypothetical protein